VSPPLVASPAAEPVARLTVDGALSPDWAAAAIALRAQLETRSDLDADARVTILSTGDAVVVHVSLPDGRSTVRRVVRPEDLATTVEILLMVPPLRKPQPSAPPVAPAPSAAPSTTFEVGIGSSTHLTFSPRYFAYGLGTHAQVTTRDWVVGAASRWDIDVLGTGQKLPGGFNMQGLQLGSFVGRRLTVGQNSVDVALGPGVAIENQEADSSSPEGIGGTRAEAVVSAFGRLSRPVGSSFRLFATLALDALPSRLRTTRRLDPDLPPLPSWGLGLALGVAWEARLPADSMRSHQPDRASHVHTWTNDEEVATAAASTQRGLPSVRRSLPRPEAPTVPR
jgi:hypothetical protein